MKIIYRYTVLLFLIQNGFYSQQYWIREISPTTGYLRSCSFTDTLNGWISGDSGIILHTTNGGESWLVQNSGINYQISLITFLNPRIGWGIANNYLSQGTAILKSTDGGTNWNYSLFPDTSLIFKTIYFPDSLHGFLGGLNGIIYRTSNAGLNWYICPVDSGIYSHRIVNSFRFYNNTNGIAAGGNFDGGGVIWRTVNGGISWTSMYVCPEPIFDIVLLDSTSIIGSGGDYEFGIESIKTTDGGTNWIYKPLQAFGIGYSIAARTGNEFWIAPGFGSSWELTRDGGNNYFSVSVPDTSGISDVKFVDSLHGWAVGSNGAIYKYNQNVIGISPVIRNVPSGFYISQNYPNPFNPQTRINFGISVEAYIIITIYDAEGRELSIPVNGSYKPGNYSINWNGEEYASGIYFYRMNAGLKDNTKFAETRKMILLK